MDFIPLVKYFPETQSASFISFLLRSFLTCEGCEGFQSNINVGELSLTDTEQSRAPTGSAGTRVGSSKRANRAKRWWFIQQIKTTKLTTTKNPAFTLLQTSPSVVLLRLKYLVLIVTSLSPSSTIYLIIVMLCSLLSSRKKHLFWLSPNMVAFLWALTWNNYLCITRYTLP